MARTAEAEPWKMPIVPKSYNKKELLRKEERSGVIALGVSPREFGYEMETVKTNCRQTFCLGKETLLLNCISSQIPVFCQQGYKIQVDKDCIVYAGPGCLVDPGKNGQISRMSKEESDSFQIPSEILLLCSCDDSIRITVSFGPENLVFAAGNSLIQATASCQIILSPQASLISPKKNK